MKVENQYSTFISKNLTTFSQKNKKEKLKKIQVPAKDTMQVFMHYKSGHVRCVACIQRMVVH